MAGNEYSEWISIVALLLHKSYSQGKNAKKVTTPLPALAMDFIKNLTQNNQIDFKTEVSGHTLVSGNPKYYYF